MNLLLWCEIRRDNDLPAFGGRFREHMAAKRNPEVYAASISAWNLLAEGLKRLGIEALPDVEFTDWGKPYFVNCRLQFSLSHSGSIAAALISDQACGLDVEIIREELAEKLKARVLSDDEIDMDFFEVWTKKEAAGKLSGRGLSSKPREMNLSKFEKMQLFKKRITDSQGREYFLTAVCENREIIVENKEIIEEIKETDC